ncbi:MAG: helix-turn-helix transcriptional regulator [Anaerovoracaceae bacterium]
MRINERVKQYICDNHLKQISISDNMGIPNPIFNAMLNGKRKMYVDDFEKFCNAVGVSADFILGYGEKEQNTTR